jgi:hypothetical protein
VRIGSCDLRVIFCSACQRQPAPRGASNRPANRVATCTRCASVSGAHAATVARTWARCSGVSRSVRRFGVPVMAWSTSMVNRVVVMNDASRFKERLGSHIGFLERSSELYDSGQEDESLRLATSMRLIFHDTNSSTSALSHLQLKGTQMLSSSRGHGNWQDYLAHEINLASSRPVVMKPLLGDAFVAVPLADWWEGESIFVHNGTQSTRKRIILSLGNKDGGAHVDAKLEAYYKVLCAGEYALGITGNMTYAGPPPFPQGIPIYPDNAHLALARQFAHETLASQSQFGWPVA